MKVYVVTVYNGSFCITAKVYVFSSKDKAIQFCEANDYIIRNDFCDIFDVTLTEHQIE